MNKKIENVKIMILLSFILFLFGSCRENNTANVILNSKIQKFKTFPINTVGNVNQLKYAILSEPEFMVYFDSMLFFTYTYPKKDLIGAYLLEQEEYKPIIYTGNGPNEGISTAGLGTNRSQNEFWFYDNLKKNIAYIPLARLFAKNERITRKEPIPDDDFWNIERLNDSIFIAFASMVFPQKKITIINSYTHSVQKRVGDYYKTNGCPIEGVSQVFFASIKAKPEGDRFVCAYYRTDVIEIYNENGDLIYSIQGPDCFSANYKIDEISTTGVKFHPVEKVRIAYNSLSTTSRYIYALYNNRFIHVFDWNGTPIKRIILGQDEKEQASIFCVDSQDCHLFYYSETYGRFCKMKL